MLPEWDVNCFEHYFCRICGPFSRIKLLCSEMTWKDNKREKKTWRMGYYELSWAGGKQCNDNKRGKCPIWLFATPWAVAHQAPRSMGFSRQECWSGLPFPSLKRRQATLKTKKLINQALKRRWASYKAFEILYLNLNTNVRSATFRKWFPKFELAMI